MKHEMTHPCANCPFRSDIGFPLRRSRIIEIQRSLVRGEFPCHKTVEYGDEGEANVPDSAQHCAGALILLEKLEQPSQMMRICERLGLYDHRKLDMDAPVYDSFAEMIDGCTTTHTPQ